MVPRFSISSSPRHADARVRDGQRVCVCVEVHADFELRVAVHHVAVGQHLKLQPVQCVRCVGNQLAQKDFALGYRANAPGC